MIGTLANWLEFFAHSAQMLLIFMLIFGGLSKLMPCNPGQPLWRKDSLTDLIYALVSPLFSMVGRLIWIALFGTLLSWIISKDNMGNYMKDGFGPLSTLPIWLQAAMVLMIEDVILYWIHRGFHKRRFWKFHAIHHSSTQIDWLSTHRFHFVNTWMSFLFADMLMMTIGFSAHAIAAMATVNAIYSAMVHANLNWTFGPFKYAFASPVFHRWHHTTEKEGYNKNYAPTFPIIDVIFGTFYMPEGKLPQNYGITGAQIPDGFFAQLDWPFKKPAKKG